MATERASFACEWRCEAGMATDGRRPLRDNITILRRTSDRTRRGLCVGVSLGTTSGPHFRLNFPGGFARRTFGNAISADRRYAHGRNLHLTGTLISVDFKPMEITCNHKSSKHGIPVMIEDDLTGDGQIVLEYAAGIKHLRSILKMSTKELAKACGVSQRTVEGWEIGRWAKQTPNAAALNVMAQLLRARQARNDDLAGDAKEDEVFTGHLTEKEKKLARLMLDKAAQPGEVANSALKFAESLRRRGVRVLAPKTRKRVRSPFW
jgi:transcriptional regulator with XRE-family HTH domain